MPLSQLRTQLLVVWRSGSALVSIDEVNLRRARLVVRRVTVFLMPDIYLGGTTENAGVKMRHGQNYRAGKCRSKPYGSFYTWLIQQKIIRSTTDDRF